MDKEKKIINLTANQAINKKFMEVFEIEFSKYTIEDIDLWTINWIDPDGKTTKIELEK